VSAVGKNRASGHCVVWSLFDNCAEYTPDNGKH